MLNFQIAVESQGSLFQVHGLILWLPNVQARWISCCSYIQRADFPVYRIFARLSRFVMAFSFFFLLENWNKIEGLVSAVIDSCPNLISLTISSTIERLSVVHPFPSSPLSIRFPNSTNFRVRQLWYVESIFLGGGEEGVCWRGFVCNFDFSFYDPGFSPWMSITLSLWYPLLYSCNFTIRRVWFCLLFFHAYFYMLTFISLCWTQHVWSSIGIPTLWWILFFCITLIGAVFAVEPGFEFG